MNKKDRELIFNKYGGKCAYCGCELKKGWHVDHIIAARRGDSDLRIERLNKFSSSEIVRGKNEIENYNPSCRQCNIWKSTLSIEKFRIEIAEQVKRLNDYNANYRNAKRYGLVQETGIEVKFYFETVKTIYELETNNRN